MTRDRDDFDLLLDNEGTQSEREAALTAIAADPVLAQELRDLTAATRMLKQNGGMTAPPSFTRDVLRRLPCRKPTLAARLRNSLFGGWTMRWNTASAAAVMLVAAVAALFLILHFRQNSDMVLVHLEFTDPRATRVAVAGDFNKWNTDTHVMTGRAGTWSIDLRVKPGIHTYMLNVDGVSWVSDPRAARFQDDGFGNRNAVLLAAI